MLIVAAVGGNALLRRGQPLTAEFQEQNARIAAVSLAALAQGNTLVITHGNGPQIGLLALQNEALAGADHSPFDVLGAESQGMVGYVLETALRNELPGAEIATVLGGVLVHSSDQAFRRPTKPIGPVYSAPDVAGLQERRGWTLGPDGDGFRRLVPSPEPVEVMEIQPVRRLAAAGVITITAGGGGVPLVRDADGKLRGVEAVVDKDLTASLLAHQLGADALLLLTDVDGVYLDWPDPHARCIRSSGAGGLTGVVFAPGSMGPKVEAAVRFARATGNPAHIGAMGDARALLSGDAGTTILAAPAPLEFWGNNDD